MDALGCKYSSMEPDLLALINRTVVDGLSQNTLLSWVQNGFTSSKINSYILAVIANRISEAIDGFYGALLVAHTIFKSLKQFGNFGAYVECCLWSLVIPVR